MFLLYWSNSLEVYDHPKKIYILYEVYINLLDALYGDAPHVLVRFTGSV